MFKVHVVIVDLRGALISSKKLYEIFERKFHVGENYKIENGKMKVFFKDPISLSDVDKLSITFALEHIRVKEINWKYEKKINNGTGFLTVNL